MHSLLFGLNLAGFKALWLLSFRPLDLDRLLVSLVHQLLDLLRLLTSTYIFNNDLGAFRLQLQKFALLWHFFVLRNIKDHRRLQGDLALLLLADFSRRLLDGLIDLPRLRHSHKVAWFDGGPR